MTLRYPYEVRDEQSYFEDIPELKLPKDMLDLASHIVSNKSGHFDPSHFEDRYENALVDLLKKKSSGRAVNQRLMLRIGESDNRLRPARVSLSWMQPACEKRPLSACELLEGFRGIIRVGLSSWN
jgi:DNA end-binding protein Ku